VGVRRALGLALYGVGAVLLSIAGGRYVVGMLKADTARRAWNDAEAREAVALAQAAAVHGWGDRATGIRAGAPVARLVIPRIDLDEIVLEGVGADELNALPGHLPGSALPGERGNAVISAHRDRHFNELDAVKVGDTITTESGQHATSWLVVSKRVVGRNAPALFRTSEPTLTLTTCWPIRFFGPAPDRLILTAKPLPDKRVAVLSN